MAKKKYITEKRYIVHFCTPAGFCYRSTYDCPKHFVDEQKRIAKLTGDKIKTEIDRIIKYEI